MKRRDIEPIDLCMDVVRDIDRDHYLLQDFGRNLISHPYPSKDDALEAYRTKRIDWNYTRGAT